MKQLIMDYLNNNKGTNRTLNEILVDNKKVIVKNYNFYDEEGNILLEEKDYYKKGGVANPFRLKDLKKETNKSNEHKRMEWIISDWSLRNWGKSKKTLSEIEYTDDESFLEEFLKIEGINWDDFKEQKWEESKKRYIYEVEEKEAREKAEDELEVQLLEESKRKEEFLKNNEKEWKEFELNYQNMRKEKCNFWENKVTTENLKWDDIDELYNEEKDKDEIVYNEKFEKYIKNRNKFVIKEVL